MKSSTRRRFLKQATGGALILGLPQLVSGVPVTTRATSLEKARARMAAHGLHGVAIAIPERAAPKKQVGRALEAFVTWPMAEALRLVGLEAVYVCAPRKDLPIGKDENVVLLDPKGKRVAGVNMSFAGTPEMARGFKALLNDDGRRKKRVDAAATPELRKAVAAIGDLPEGRYWDARTTIWNDRRRAMPLVIAALDDPRTTKVHEQRLMNIVHSAWSMLEMESPPTLPYGLEWKVTRKAIIPEPCPPCGMARPQPPARKFLRFAK